MSEQVARLLSRGPAPSRIEAAHAYGQVRRALFGLGEASRILGRYTLLEMLGGTLHSEVFSAHDAQLDRVVALKLLPLTEVDHDTALGEARALAGIAHRNVVTVFDAGLLPAAETGDRFDRVYLAMELLTGPTLGAWLAQRPRGWRGIVDAFVEAGAGLCAAHRVGITHCDFKPDNVIVPDAGAIKVVDFGLSRRDLADPVVRVAGTPAYMAPEQLDGTALDHRVDQYAFCVALYEAVYRAQPFEGRTLQELARHKRAAEVRPPLVGTTPRFLWPIVRRGMDPDPRRRWESMEAVVALLRRGLGRRRRIARGGIALLGVSCVAAAVVTTRRPACEDGSALLDDVWNEPIRRRVADAFAATELPEADDAWARARDRIDRWAGTWAEAHAKTCELPPEELAAVRLCLDTRLYALSELVTLLEQPDHRTIRGAAIAAAALPDVDGCVAADPVAVATPPSSAFERDLARVAAQYDLGRYADAVAQADAMIHRYGDEPGPRARARLDLALGQARAKNDDSAGAEAALRRAWSEAERIGDAELAVWALVRLVWVVGELEHDRDRAESLLDVAEAKLEPLGDPDRLRAEVATLRGHLVRADDPRAAEAHYREALRAHRAAYGDDDRRVAESLTNLGQTADTLGRPAEAREHLDAALRIWAPLLGDTHPLRAVAEHSLGVTHLGEGHPEAALPHLERAHAQARTTLGSGAVTTASFLATLAVARAQLGDHDVALAAMQDALDVLEERLGVDAVEVLEARSNLGIIHLERGDMQRAHEILADVVRALEAGGAPNGVVLGNALFGLARATHARDPAAARALAKRASEVSAAAGAPGSLDAEIRTWLDGPGRL